MAYRRTILFLLLFGLSACLPGEPLPGEEGAAEDGVPRIQAVMASIKEIALSQQTKGAIVPASRFEIKAAFNGIVAQVLVSDGQKIESGTTVLRYDTELPRLKLELARAEEDEAESAIDYEQNRFENRDELLDDDEISSTVYDLIEQKLEYERSRLARARAEINYLQEVTKQQAVISPIAGVVTSFSVADQMPVVEGQFLMEIIQDDPVKLQIRLPEEFIPVTYREQPLQVRFPALNDETMTVLVTDVGVEVDQLTGTFDVWAEIANPDGRYKSGMEADVTLVTDQRTRVLAIPKSSVALRDKKTVVFRLEDDVAVATPVRLGKTFDDDVAVQKGLDEGAIIALDPPANLNDGDRVEITTTTASPES